MKKLIIIFAALVLASATNAQSQRTVLIEEFTQASCDPCEFQNSTFFNPLISANTSPIRKVVSIKYQTSWPGVDPMNAQNPIDVATRVNYYGVQGVPNACIDGSAQQNVLPGEITQASIDARYAVSSPFDITLSHQVSNDGDSVYVTMSITCTQVTNGAFVAQIGVIEEEIHFATAPGTNGEKDFFGVMKKMLPNANGTTLPTTWVVGQTQTVTQAWAIGNSVIYNINKIGVVAWVQNNTNKEVAQAAYSNPIPSPNNVDAGLVIPAPAYLCATNYTPSITLNNTGGMALTSCDIQYSYDGGATQIYNWTGNLAYGASTIVTLPTVTMTNGPHNIQLTVTNTNAFDVFTLNNQKTLFFFTSVGNTSLPVTETFWNLPVFPANTWYSIDVDNNGRGWEYSFYNMGCAKLDYFNIRPGSIDDLYMPVANLTTVTAPQLTFDIAHQQFASVINDELQVNVSTDCGFTWTTVYQKNGTALATVPGTAIGFYTPANEDWRLETVDLANYANETNLLIRFRGISAQGNNIYIDNVNLNGAQDVFTTEKLTSNLTLAPNPANELVKVDFSLNNSSNVTIQVVNTLSQVVFTQSQDLAAGAQTLNIDTASLANGTYTISLISDSKVSAKCFIVAH